MSNSSLVTYRRISPNRTSPRNHKIDTITIHCMAGNLSVETCGNLFADPSRKTSSNYGIGSDGRIAMYVEEKDRSWCTSDKANDNRAITIEVANDGGANTGWHVSDKAYASLIKLLVDICKRNNIKKLLWRSDKSLIGQVDKQNMTVHRWFANKSCPGDYLYKLHYQIADEVNHKLTSEQSDSSKKPLYRVQVGAFTYPANAQELLEKVQKAGFKDSIIVKSGSLYKVQVGAYSVKSNALAMQDKLEAAKFDSFLTTDAGTVVSTEVRVPATVKIGSRVRVRTGAKTYTGASVASFVYQRVYTVDQLRGDRAVLDTKGLCTAFNTKDLIVQ